MQLFPNDVVGGWSDLESTKVSLERLLSNIILDVRYYRYSFLFQVVLGEPTQFLLKVNHCAHRQVVSQDLKLGIRLHVYHPFGNRKVIFISLSLT